VKACLRPQRRQFYGLFGWTMQANLAAKPGDITHAEVPFDLINPDGGNATEKRKADQQSENQNAAHQGEGRKGISLNL